MTSVLQLSKLLANSPQVITIDGFNFRTFNTTDVESWLELRHRSFACERLGVRRWTPADFEAEFRQRWWWNPAKMWLAEANSGNSRLLGSVTLAMRGEPPYVAESPRDSQAAIAKPVVHWLMVAPEARRRGLARTLMSHLEHAAWTAGYRQIWLETHAAWQAAAKFYQSLGYNASGENTSAAS
jgi:GNAT superfamily N-acetyltransferase